MATGLRGERPYSARPVHRRGWPPGPYVLPQRDDVDRYPVEEALATPGNWYRHDRGERLVLFDLAQCRIVTDFYDG